VADDGVHREARAFGCCRRDRPLFVRRKRLQIHQLPARDVGFRRLKGQGHDRGEAEAIAWAAQLPRDQRPLFISVDKRARDGAKENGVPVGDILDLMIEAVDCGDVTYRRRTREGFNLGRQAPGARTAARLHDLRRDLRETTAVPKVAIGWGHWCSSFRLVGGAALHGISWPRRTTKPRQSLSCKKGAATSPSLPSNSRDPRTPGGMGKFRWAKSRQRFRLRW